MKPAVSSPAASVPARDYGQRGALIDPASLMRIRSLELRAKVVVEGFWTGLHRSPYHGFSVEFTEYRQYSPGDDPRYLDWRLYARSDRYYIKKFEDETNLRCHLLVDNSRSMSYGSLAYTKGQYANTLAATLAYFLFLQGDATGLLTFDEGLRDFLPARHRKGHLRQLMLALEKPAGGTSTDLDTPLRHAAEIVTKRGLLILISDLLAPVASLERNLISLTARGHQVQLLQILDPAELRFDFKKATVFEDLETSRDLYVDPALIRKDYLDQVGVHNQSIRSLCQRLGVQHDCFSTERPLELALFDFLRAQLRRSGGVKRSGTRPTRGPG
ncbi:MAG TPA: DUF58 domain-containing protein [Methylomirabilota bacterium]|nr:DUF58 domain-containing protein [Methylomirabilota bacterium]